MSTETTTTPRPDFRSTSRMSNSGYHRQGQPTWWARIGSRFLAIPRQRADEYITIPRAILEAERPAAGEQPVVIEYGAGAKDSKDAIRGRLSLTPRI